jgi:hypothetical protein
MDRYGRFRIEQRIQEEPRRRINTCVLSAFGEAVDAPEVFRVAVAVTDGLARQRGVDPLALARERATERLKGLIDAGTAACGVCYRATEGLGGARHDEVSLDEHPRRPMPYLS